MKLLSTATALFLLICTQPIFAENFKSVFRSDNGIAMCRDRSDNLYTTGDSVLIKYNPAGIKQMSIPFSGAGIFGGTSITIDDSDNIYIEGYYTKTLTIGPVSVISSGNTDICLIKINASGSVKWIRSCGSVGGYESARSIAIDKNRNIYISGLYQDSCSFGKTLITGKGGNNIFIARYDNNGNFTWAQKGEGDNSSDFLNIGQIAVDNSGNCYMTGSFLGHINFYNKKLTASNISDGFIVCFNSASSIAWVKQVTNGDVSCIAVDNKTGSIYTTGTFTASTDIDKIHLTAPGGSSATDIFMAKIDKNANVKWANSIGGTYYDDVASLELDSLNNIYIGGGFSETASFGKTSLTSNGELDIFVARYDSNGVNSWALGTGADGEDGVSCICLNKAENSLFVLGNIENGPVAFGATQFNGTNFLATLANTSTGIENGSDNVHFKVYPNPSPGNVTISISKSFEADAKLCLTDMLGKQVILQQTVSDQENIRLENIPAGMYILSIHGQNTTEVQKLIVR